MDQRRFKQVDVFTHRPFRGNPVAVILRAEGLSTGQMQQIANWTNLSETTFVVPPTESEADYRVRIFTPQAELPFAGHPTIGTAHALLEAGLIEARHGRLIQQCGAGLVSLDVTTGEDGRQWIAFTLPPPTIKSVAASRVQEVEAILGSGLKPGTKPLLIDVGPRWLVAQLADAQAVLALTPDLVQMAEQDRATGDAGIIVFGEYPAGASPRIEVRAFAPAHGINEDPVCGSGNGCIAAYIRHTDQHVAFGHDFLASEGRVLGRDGLLRLRIEPERIQVGGNAVTCIDGELAISHD